MKQSIQHRFEHFDASNPQVYKLFVKFAKLMRASGHTRYSADAILHRIRWHYAELGPEHVHYKGEYVLNDHFSSRYARKMIAEHPLFTNFFEIRELRAA